MQQAINAIITLIVGLFHIVIVAIAAAETVLRESLAPLGLDTASQNVVLIVTALFMIIAAIRFFGGIFAILCTAVLVLLMLHTLLPALGMHA